MAEAGDASHAEEEEDNDEAQKVAASLLEMTAGPPPPSLIVGDFHDEDSPSKTSSPGDGASPGMPTVKVWLPFTPPPPTHTFLAIFPATWAQSPQDFATSILPKQFIVG